MSKERLIDGNIVIDDADLLRGKYRNFSGRKGTYNKEGDKNFCVYIHDDDLATDLQNQGWNIKIQAPRDETEKAKSYISVAVNWNREYPHLSPKIILVSGRTQTQLTEDMVHQLDSAEIAHVDLAIRPRVWTNDAGEEHIKAYLKEMWVTLETGYFGDKYGSFDEQEGPGEEIPF